MLKDNVDFLYEKDGTPLGPSDRVAVLVRRITSNKSDLIV